MLSALLLGAVVVLPPLLALFVVLAIIWAAIYFLVPTPPVPANFKSFLLWVIGIILVVLVVVLLLRLVGVAIGG